MGDHEPARRPLRKLYSIPLVPFHYTTEELEYMFPGIIYKSIGDDTLFDELVETSYNYKLDDDKAVLLKELYYQKMAAVVIAYLQVIGIDVLIKADLTGYYVHSIELKSRGTTALVLLEIKYGLSHERP